MPSLPVVQYKVVTTAWCFLCVGKDVSPEAMAGCSCYLVASVSVDDLIVIL